MVRFLEQVGDYSASQSGLIFLISALLYSMSTQFVGVLAKKNEKSYKYMILGTVLCLLSCVVIGPMPGIPMEPLVALRSIFEHPIGCPSKQSRNFQTI